jgi:nucleotide-binding universal stress UspA family protein
MVDAPSEVVIRQNEKNIKDVLREGVDRLRARGLSATGHLVFDNPMDQIPVVARRLGVDLIVVGHRPWPDRAMVGGPRQRAIIGPG